MSDPLAPQSVPGTSERPLPTAPGAMVTVRERTGAAWGVVIGGGVLIVLMALDVLLTSGGTQVSTMIAWAALMVLLSWSVRHPTFFYDPESGTLFYVSLWGAVRRRYPGRSGGRVTVRGFRIVLERPGRRDRVLVRQFGHRDDDFARLHEAIWSRGEAPGAPAPDFRPPFLKPWHPFVGAGLWVGAILLLVAGRILGF